MPRNKKMEELETIKEKGLMRIDVNIEKMPVFFY
jgi:hypothetical protein